MVDMVNEMKIFKNNKEYIFVDEDEYDKIILSEEFLDYCNCDEGPDDFSIDGVKAYLAKGVDVNATFRESKYIALHYQCYANNYDVIKLLLEAGADPNAVTDYDEMPLMMVANATRNETAAGIKSIDLLIEYGADPTLIIKTKEDYSRNINLLSEYCERTWRQNLEVLKHIIKCIEDWNYKNKKKE